MRKMIRICNKEVLSFGGFGCSEGSTVLRNIHAGIAGVQGSQDMEVASLRARQRVHRRALTVGAAFPRLVTGMSAPKPAAGLVPAGGTDCRARRGATYIQGFWDASASSVLEDLRDQNPA